MRPRDRLHEYEIAEEYVFHGSDNGAIAEFEPRQALSFQKPDGDPAIFAAASIEPAIFMAVLGSRRAAGWDSSRFEPPFGFYISESNFAKAQSEDWSGYVYVLPRKPFTKGHGWVWRATTPVKPIAAIKVTGADLPAAITVLSDADEAAYVAANS